MKLIGLAELYESDELIVVTNDTKLILLSVFINQINAEKIFQ